MSLWRGQSSNIATAPLASVSVALVLAVWPLLDRVAPWAVAVFVTALALRLMVNFQQLRLPSLPLKMVLLAVGVGGVALSYGGLTGVEPGLGVLLILLSLKLLETNTVRDFQVLVLLGWFLCLCGLFFSQDLTAWIYLSGVGALLAASLIRFHSAPSCGGLFRSLGVALKMVVQALPIVLLLFLFFPRTQGGFRQLFNRSLNAVTGMSDQLSPGSFARLTQNENIAFRAEFLDGKLPSLSQLYWRGAVFWRGDGLTWTRGRTDLGFEGSIRPLEGPAIRQKISLMPHGGNWLFALDRPAATEVRDFAFDAGGCLQSNRPIVARQVYEVISRPENRETTLLPTDKTEALQLPKVVAPRVKALVDSWRSGSDHEVIELALRYFRKEKFTYSLAPQTYGADALTEFLFDRRTGFCEHYAAAFATLMRLAGIPSRVVAGYHGGEVGLGNYLIVKQLDAHAWTEVWVKGEGWLRIDPTMVIAPDRITSGSESFLESQALADSLANGGTSLGVVGLRDLLREARLVWDNLKYQWDLRVLSYDEDSQHNVLTLVGLDSMAPSTIMVWLIIGILLLCGLIGLALGRSRRVRREPLQRDYQRFCRILAVAGVVPREPWEGPQHFSERAAAALPQHATAIRKAAASYIAARYARESAAASSFQREVRALPRLARLPPRANSRNK